MEDNGEQAMCKAYAAVQPADAIISFMDESSAHAQMIIEAPHVVYMEGSNEIDPDQSYVVIQDQHKGILKTGEPFVTTVDGQRVHYAGHVRQEVKFSSLLKSCYVPVTAAEFIGTKAYDVPSIETDLPEVIEKLDDVKDVTIHSAYKIITVVLKVKDGDEVALQSKRILGRPEIQDGTALNYKMSNFTMPSDVNRKLEKGKTYTLTLEVLLAPGTTHTALEIPFTYNG